MIGKHILRSLGIGNKYIEQFAPWSSQNSLCLGLTCCDTNDGWDATQFLMRDSDGTSVNI